MAPKINRKLRLPNNEFFMQPCEKSGICIHHTVGGSALSTLEWWKQDKQMVGTAYIIDNDGTIFEVFEPKYWAWQFGLPWSANKKIPFEKRFIGIEIASVGGLKEYKGEFYCFDRINPKNKRPPSKVYDHGQPYRGYRYFEKYTKAQIDSLVELIGHLAAQFNIPKAIADNFTDYYGLKLENFKGVIGHAMIREDKSDPMPNPAFWERVVKDCNLSSHPVSGQRHPAPTGLDKTAIEALFASNVGELKKMDLAAASMVKGLLWELQDEGRNTYIRLKNAASGGHVVSYEMVQGDEALVKMAAETLGFKSWDNNRLEVFSV